jgi:hypothetical protein
MKPTTLPFLPLLRFNEQHILRISSKYRFWGMSDQFFDEGGFGFPTCFIDSNLNHFEILNVSKKRLSYNLIDMTGWVEQKFRYRVDYELSAPVQFSFQEAKKTIVDLVVRKRWYAQGGQTKARFMNAFDKFTRMEQMIGNISAYGNPPF